MVPVSEVRPARGRLVCRSALLVPACHGIAYGVENEDKLSRVLRRSNKLRERVGARAGTAYPVLFKPKGMHQKTFDRIRWEIEAIEAGFWLATAERFGFQV